jgi:TetR/AcrR family transcriptional regulator, ethionamide resistance regulator
VIPVSTRGPAGSASPPAPGPHRRKPVRRRGDSAATRSNLLESARALADSRSVPEFTVDDIASGAGVSRAAFYMHFENKLAICQEVARTSHAAFIEAVQSFERGPDLRTTILAGVRAYINGFRTDRPGMRMTFELAYAEPAVRELVHTTRNTVYGLWQIEFTRAVAAGECPPFDIPLVTRLLVGMLETFCVRTTRTAEYSGTSAADGNGAAAISELWFRALLLEG